MREIAGMPKGDVAEHRAVVEAIRTGDPEEARRAMIAHIRRFAELLKGFEYRATPAQAQRR